MAFLWFKSGVGFWHRRRALTFIHKERDTRPISVGGFPARGVLEISLDKRLGGKAQAISLGDMFKVTSLGQDTFDIKWLLSRFLRKFLS